MNAWSAQDAEARFTAFLDACRDAGPQVVTRDGTEAAVLVPIEKWEAMRKAARPTLKDLLLTDEARSDALVPSRTVWKLRAPPDFD